MKTISGILAGLSIFFITDASWASCRVYIPNKLFSHAGYSIQFDFTEVLQKKGYTEVTRSPEADHTLDLEGTERIGRRFHFAEAQISMSGIRGSFEKVCITQLCGIQDFARSFLKAYRQFDRNLPRCQ